MTNSAIADPVAAKTPTNEAGKSSVNPYALVFGGKKNSVRNDTMLAYFLSVLDVRIRSIAQRIRESPENAGKLSILKDIESKLPAVRDIADPLDNDAAWTEAYRLERLVALVEPADNLATEVQRRVDEAVEENVSSAKRLQTRLDDALKKLVDSTGKPLDDPVKTEAALRPLLLDVLEETHWTQQKKFTMRPIQRQACERIISAAFVVFLLIIAPYVRLYWFVYHAGAKPVSFMNWSWLPLYTALTAGLFGALFSRLQSLQGSWNTLSLGQVRDARDWGSIMLRGAVGMGGALVVYFFLQSNIVSGNLFPQFDKIGIAQYLFPDKSIAGVQQAQFRVFQPDEALALLLIWSFVAGFSERLVPGILSATETSLGNAAEGQKR